MSAFDRRVDPKVREVRRLEVINGALGHQARQGRLVLPAEELSFVPVVRTAAAEAPPVANSAPPAGIIEVALGDAVVRVPPAVDRRLLTKVLRRAGAGVILPGGRFAVFVATRAVDFRKRMDGLAAVVQQQLHLDPFCGAVFVFRAKRADCAT